MYQFHDHSYCIGYKSMLHYIKSHSDICIRKRSM
ncbi:hypothetical protein T4B_3207 [Trichinella pseudospiralis]|uniref:Uncharacterized protein n=1 Tax=Trichinella pseudospiralis TaxID=6337 RepID=A0A0V1GGC4_TRIPS|nr:hypothetical protein T4B_3207 [Trichinella pseudospiralis]